ncbi:toll/interleukin-1 receptor domain-containing protein [Candidatus Entotheonella palauensis]|uniref:toll/interleukin-1 receptor domain-containing protein n=1 Tax=Candidatus Entotheonella palauensis TaxID=93172 RepID=UPI000B7D7906|nr:toll/interleukin-1 receptor domain-containing protein [Candidatus Entotheonella palauensis]
MSALKLVAGMIMQYWHDANTVPVDRRHHVQRLAQRLEREVRMNATIRHDPDALQSLLVQWATTDLNMKRIIEKLVPNTTPNEDTVHQAVSVQGCGNMITVVGGDMIGVSQEFHSPARMSLCPRVDANVFISYRRSASQYFADKIYHSLLTKMHGNIFYDIETMSSGALSENIIEAIRQSDIVLCVISHGTLDRLGQTDDWVRLEIAEALRLGKPLIPVVDGDILLPAVDMLPDDVQELLTCQRVTIYPKYFKAGIEELLRLIDQ